MLKTLIFTFRIILLIALLFSSPGFAQHEHENTTLIGRWARGPYSSVAAQGDIVLFGCGSTLRIFDYSDPEEPEEIGDLVLSYVVNTIQIAGRYAYLAVSGYGLYIVDISDPTDPEIVGQTERFPASRFYLDGDILYISSHSDGLRIFNVSNPTEPQQIAVYETPGRPNDVVVQGDYAYLAMENPEPGLYVLGHEFGHTISMQHLSFADSSIMRRPKLIEEDGFRLETYYPTEYSDSSYQQAAIRKPKGE